MKKIMLMMFLLLGMGTWSSAQGVADSKSKNDCNVIVSYNPASKVIHIEMPDVNTVTHVDIVSRTGQVMYSADAKHNPHEINITDWYQGIFYVVLDRPNGSSVARVIKT